MPSPKDIITFFREYPWWVWPVVVLCTGIVGLVLIYARTLSETGELARVFANTAELYRDSHIEDVLARSKTFDLIAFSANVFKVYQAEFIQAIDNGTRVRLILYDPGALNASAYDCEASLIGETPQIKREEAGQVMAAVRRITDNLRGKRHGSIEVRFLSGKPLLYNMWISNFGMADQCAHMSIYFYRGLQHSPSFRYCNSSSMMIQEAAEEFQEVWDSAIRTPSANR